MRKLFIASTLFFMSQTNAQTQTTMVLPNDLFKVEEYTLSNGLKVFISPNTDAPRVQTMIAVKAGSKYDPAETTGLAHYLEHMMFKGTSNYGSLDWEKEKVLLAQLSDLFEKHLQEKDTEKKKAIYRQIDSLSYETSKLAIPSEYDKMVASIGASGTNAFTSNDMTVYVNEIPSNSVEKWAKLEGERFSELVLRLFHTELETVYEEFNRNQDADIRWSNFAVDNMLIPNHPYGTQTTIGLGEHLKNPSMVNIHNYFNNYYVPNNMAVILSGDVKAQEVLPILEKYFGVLKTKDVPVFKKEPPVALTKVQEKEVFGPTQEHVIIGFRFDGDGTRESLTARAIDMLLTNGAAGLIDLNLKQKQKVLNVYTYVNTLKDYSIFKLYAEPKAGQTLEEARDLLLAQIELIKKGEFDEEMLKANVANMKLNRLQSVENNRSRAGAIMDAFVKDISWKYRVNELDEMAKLTKEDIVGFANKYFENNYAVAYKRLGEPDRHKVEKPVITPVVLNKDSISTFKENFDKIAQGNIKAKFINFEKDIERIDGNGDKFLYIRNEHSPLFSLSLVHNYGTDNNQKLALAAEYISYLGTNDLTNDEVKTRFYKLGLSYKVSASRDRFEVSLSGLEENLQTGIDLLLNVLQNAKANEAVLDNLINDILKKRANAKLNKTVIHQQALLNYAKYGKNNPFTNTLSENELKGTSAAELLWLIKQAVVSPEKITYYGQQPKQQVFDLVTSKLVSGKANIGAAKKFTEQPIEKPIVYYTHYNMQQAEILLLTKSQLFNANFLPYLNLFNDYYGRGLSSVMFQEIREKMALAYAASSSFGIPQYKNESHYITSYIGTQADKLETALNKMNDLLTNFVESPKQFDDAKSSLVRNLESDWITGEQIFSVYERAQKRGLNTDISSDIYNKVKTLELEDLKKFYKENISGKPHHYIVIGNKEKIDFEVLKKLGELKELSLEEVFGY